MVGLLPLIAVEVLDDELLEKLPGFTRRMRWFLENRQDLGQHISYLCTLADRPRCQRLLAIPSQERLERILRVMLDESEFLSPHGLRALSRTHLEHPYRFDVQGNEWRVDYVPGEGTSGFFGGNSNWRGPVWFPVNYLLIEALERKLAFESVDIYTAVLPLQSVRAMEAALVMGVVLWFLRDWSPFLVPLEASAKHLAPLILNVLIVGGVGICAYVAALATLKFFTAEDIRFMSKLFKRSSVVET